PTVLALLDRVAELEAKVARMEALRQAAEVVVLDAGDDATGPEPDPNLAELAHCVAALAGEADIRADAWDEGYAAGFCESRHPFKSVECAPHENPYRQE